MRDLWYGTAGSRNARAIFVAESWGREELACETPLIGQSGKELFRMLGESKAFGEPLLHIAALGATTFSEWILLRNEWLSRNSILFTNVIADHPPGNDTWRFFHENTKGDKSVRIKGLRPTDHTLSEVTRLKTQIATCNPDVVVACGNYALWALTTHSSTSNIPTGTGATVSVPGGIMSWRGSMLLSTALTSSPIRVLPLIHPAAVLREWYLRTPTVHDLRTRLPQAFSGDWRRTPPPVFWAPPTFEQAKSKLEGWLAKANSGNAFDLVVDIETSRGNITCIGLTDSIHFGMAIPLVRLAEARSFDHYWSQAQEGILLRLIRLVLTNANIRIIGQNFIYDMQYFLQQLSIRPSLDFDTMLAQHLLFPGTPKGLDYISSLYCRYHWYWKDEGKEWDSRGTLEQHLLYNCEDLVRTLEASVVLRSLIRQAHLEAQWQERLDLNSLALDMMETGVPVDKKHRANLAMELALAAEELEVWFERILPDAHVKEVVQLKSKKVKPWYRSSAQQRMFFSFLGLKLPKKKKTGKETFGKEALLELKGKHPEYTRMFEALGSYRSIGVFHNTFIKAPLEPNGRMKCSFNVAGTETFRWSSSENAFGRGTNLQNIPAGDED